MRIILIVICLSLWVQVASGVLPMPGGIRLVWDRATNDVNYYAWRLNPPNTNWVYLGSTTNSTFLYTNPIPDGTMFGVTVNQRMSNGQCCVASDVGVAGWPPVINTPPKSLRLTPTNGYIVEPGKWIKVSSDLKTFDDWLKITTGKSNVIQVEHKTGALKPYLFMIYPTNSLPPFP